MKPLKNYAEQIRDHKKAGRAAPDSLLDELSTLITDLSNLRYFQRMFFKERDNEDERKKWLDKCKKWERSIDRRLMDQGYLAPDQKNVDRTGNLFNQS